MLVPLSQGNFAVIDREDSALVSSRRWIVSRGTKRNGMPGRIYAISTVEPVLLHRLIVGPPPPDVFVDHRNGDGLDCRRANLRLCNNAQNLQNHSISKRNTSGYYGVSFDKQRGTWRASIQCEKRQFHIGRFPTAKEAALARDRAAIALHRDFAALNFPEEFGREAA
jgi:hypothetical protein